MSRRRKSLPKTPQKAFITDISHEGRGIAKIDGKITFIQGALPDEEVTFQYLNKKKDFDEGVMVSVEKPSELRKEPDCPHYWMCGGCSLQHLNNDDQIKFKEAQLKDLLSRIGKVNPQSYIKPLTGHVWHYRNKARLSVRYVEKKKSTLIGFREKNNARFIADITTCTILNKRFEQELVNLRQLITSFTNPQAIAQVELAAGDDDLALIFRNMDALCEEDTHQLIQFGQDNQFKIYLQPKGPDSVYKIYPEDSTDFLTYQIPEHDITLQFHPTDFTQINADINRQMINLAIELLDIEDTDHVLDLFCGLGNFSLPIARYCQLVTGVEGSEEMVLRARENAKRNHLQNTSFHAANLDDPLSLRLFDKLKVDKLLIDPPRTGAEVIVKEIARINPSKIVYVSCNPATLARDANILVNEQGYIIEQAGIMDMFPNTAHVESIAVFTKK